MNDFEDDFEKGFSSKKPNHQKKNSIDKEINETGGDGDFDKYLNFDKLIAPSIIIILHTLCILLCVVGIIFFIYSGIIKRDYQFMKIIRIPSFSIAVIILVLYLFCRLLLEKSIVIFKIYEELKKH